MMMKLDSASAVICLLIERSVDRPRIFYEVGVAKGKLQISVYPKNRYPFDEHSKIPLTLRQAQGERDFGMLICGFRLNDFNFL